VSGLEGRVAVVTGAATGIGAATAQVLALRGARVVVADIDGSGGEAVAAGITATGGEAIAHAVDISDEAAVAGVIARTVEHFGRLDVVHNNAAATGPETLGRDNATDAIGMDIDLWDRTMAVHLRGTMLMCKHALPHLLERGNGVIVNTSSTSALAGDLVRLAYAASKAGVNALTLYLATMYGKRGLRCNAIAPGLIRSARHAGDPTRDMVIYEQNQLAPRLGLPEDIAHLVAFLASDEAAFITGQVIRADGGMLSHMPRFAQDVFGDG
jgi:NAD(P)-dependent dehydrogenase (short-subunit alcohol dehydrogenase family)